MTPTPASPPPVPPARPWSVPDPTQLRMTVQARTTRTPNPKMGRPWLDALLGVVGFFVAAALGFNLVVAIQDAAAGTPLGDLLKIQSYEIAVAMFFELLFVVLFTLWWCNRGDRSFREMLGWSVKAIDILWGILGLVVPRILLIGVVILMGGAPDDMNQADQGIISPGMNTMMILATFFAVVIAAPIAEELMFRGMLMRSMARIMPGWLAAVLSGVFFGLIHAGNYIGLSTPTIVIALSTTTLLGITLGALVQYTGRLGPSIIAHMFNNSMVFMVFIVTQN